MAKKVEFNMEKVKKYLFWICVPVGLIVAVLACLMSVRSVANDLDSRIKQLDGLKASIFQLQGKASNHPNEKTIEEINEEQKKMEDNVFDAWKIMEEAQQAMNKWDNFASDDAIRDITSKTFLDEQLLQGTLSSYLGYAREEIDKLLDNPYKDRNGDNMLLRRVQRYEFDIQNRTKGKPVESVSLIHTETERRQPGGAGFRTTGTAPVTAAAYKGDSLLEGVVVWEKPGLTLTMSDWSKEPKPFEVWLTQEDLWVYQALLWVVAKSNKGVARAPFKIIPASTASPRGSDTSSEPLNLSESVIKQIDELQIGKKAADVLTNYSKRRIGPAGSSGGGYASSSSGGSSDALAAAMANRYVEIDAQGQLTPIQDSTAVLASPFRRMPVYMEFHADQRYIADILVNCANCPMPIDVLWVRINPNAAVSFEYSPDKAKTTGGVRVVRPQNTGHTTVSNYNFGPNAVVLEIYGCINIFAKPDEGKIKTGGN